jgi:hypothetical protein
LQAVRSWKHTGWVVCLPPAAEGYVVWLAFLMWLDSCLFMLQKTCPMITNRYVKHVVVTI